LARCRALAQGACDITLVFDKGNNSADTLRMVGAGPFHFVGSLVPTQHKDLLGLPRKAMRRLDRTQLPAVWAVRTSQGRLRRRAHHPLYLQSGAVGRPDAHAPPRNRKRKRSSTGSRAASSAASPGPGARPPPSSDPEAVKEILRSRHGRLFTATVPLGRHRLPRLTVAFEGLPPARGDLWAKPSSSRIAATGPMSRSSSPTARNITSRPTSGA
jgi:hypothetical protein